MGDNIAEVRDILKAVLDSFDKRVVFGECEAECVSLWNTLENCQEDLERALRLVQGEADDEGQTAEE